MAILKRDILSNGVEKQVESYMSGHLWLGSAMETYDSCGNCDGGHCNSCLDVFEVTIYEPPEEVLNEYGWSELRQETRDKRIFTNYQEAERFYETV